jgi:hypothetical protein
MKKYFTPENPPAMPPEIWEQAKFEILGKSGMAPTRSFWEQIIDTGVELMHKEGKPVYSLMMWQSIRSGIAQDRYLAKYGQYLKVIGVTLP